MTPAALLGMAAQASAEIIVTGRALPPIDPRTPSIVVIDREEIEHSASRRLEQILLKVPGVQTFRRADSASAHPTSAGLTARGLGGNAASRMVLVVDGVPQADPFGGWVDFPLYSPNRMAKIELRRGGGQARWGSGALAGVVEIESIAPGEAPPLTGSVRRGSRDSLDIATDVMIGSDSAYVFAGGAFRRSDGFIPIVSGDRGPADIRAPYRQMNGSLRGAVALGPELELQGGFHLVDDRRERGLRNSGNRTRGGDASVRLVGKAAHPFQLTVYRQVRRFNSLFAAANADRTDSRITLDQYDVPASGWGARGEVDLLRAPIALRVGGDWRSGTGTTNERYQFVDGTPNRLREAGGAFSVAGMFAQTSLETAGLRWAVDARLDRWSVTDGRFEQRLIGGGILDRIDYPDRDGWQPSARGSLTHQRGGLTLEAAVYRGWRLPTLNELYRPFRVGADAVAANSGLRPETLRGAEITGRYRTSDAVEVSATAFANRLGDAIANVALGNGPGVFPGVGFVGAGGTYAQRLNVSSLRTHGVELAAHYRRGPLQLNAAAAITRARFHDDRTAFKLDGKQPAQIPSTAVALGASWTLKRDGFVAAELRYEGSRFDDDQNARRLSKATAIDLSGRWPLTSSFAATAAVENLFDAGIETGMSGGAVERAQPRIVWFGLVLRSRQF